MKTEVMNDREMLELAAKAAGIEYLKGDQPHLNYPDMLTLDNAERFWQPQNDDGQALRLAAKLRIDLSFEKLHTVGAYSIGDEWFYEYCDDGFGADVASKARRAIVRAAASMAEK